MTCPDPGLLPVGWQWLRVDRESEDWTVYFAVDSQEPSAPAAFAKVKTGSRYELRDAVKTLWRVIQPVAQQRAMKRLLEAVEGA
jgi:hypothetical protein